MIRNKKNFKGKCIKLPKNLSEKKFNKIKEKLEKLGFEDFRYFKYSFIYSDSYMFIWTDGDVGIWDKRHNSKEIKNLQEISIKEFLTEAKIEEDGYRINIQNNAGLDIVNVDLKIKDITIDYKVTYKGDCNPYLTIAGVEVPCCLGYKKTKEFKTAKEAIKWCYNNPMREVSYNIPNSPYIYEERYNPNVGTLGLERYFEFKNEKGNWKFDENCLTSEKTINWKNIRECEDTTPTFGLL